MLRGEAPPFAPKSAELLAAMRDFDVTYAAYAEFQRGMERYWCLRALQQDRQTDITARIIREQLVRLEHLPLVLRQLDLPTTAAPGRRVTLKLDHIDLFAAEARAHFVDLLAGEPVSDTDGDAALDEGEDVELPAELGPDAPADAAEGVAPAD